MKEYEYEKDAMGTTISVSIVTDTIKNAKKGQLVAFETITIYERCFSRFLPESELSALNRSKSMIVSPLFYEVFTESMRAHSLSSGVFNPLVQIARLGYNKNFKELATQGKVSENKPYNIQIADITVDENSRMITLLEGQELDFGGFLKGYLAEKIATSLMETFPSYQGVIINLGGDLHTRGADVDGKPFVFDILNPVTHEEISVPVQNKSLATSGTYKRTWKTESGSRHHILDKTGVQNPTSNIVSASVVHTHGTESEVYTKMFLSQHHEEVIRNLAHTAVSYFLITNNGEVIKNI